MKKENLSIEGPKKMNLLTKILGAAVITTTIFTTCSCKTYQKNADNPFPAPKHVFESYNYPAHMQITIYDPFPPSSGIYPGQN